MVLSKSLCDELMIEILNRLPRKSLFRFKCVSKTWDALISSSSSLLGPVSGLFYQTTNDHPFGRRDPTDEFITYVQLPIKIREGGYRFSPTDLSFLPIYPRYKILDCRNGFLLLCAKQNSKAYYVCSPVLKKWVALPPCKGQCYSNIALAFEPQDSPHYKVFCFVERLVPFGDLEIEIYSSETGQWVDFKLIKCRIGPYYDRRVVLMNGALHLFSGSEALVLDVKKPQSHTCVLKLPRDMYLMPRIRDLANVLEGYTDTRGHASLFPYKECLGDSGGRLWLAYFDDSQIWIWVLDDYYGDEWTLRNDTSIEALQEQYPGLGEIRSLRFLFFHPDEEVIFIRINNSMIFPYRLSNGKLEGGLSLDLAHGNSEPFFWAYPFARCLHSLEDTT